MAIIDFGVFTSCLVELTVTIVKHYYGPGKESAVNVNERPGGILAGPSWCHLVRGKLHFFTKFHLWVIQGMVRRDRINYYYVTMP